MDLVIAFSIVEFVTLIAIIFIVLLNINQARQHVRTLDFRVVSIELSTLTVWTVLLVKIFSATTTMEMVLYTVLFLLAIVCGVLLIINTIRELQTRAVMHQLLNTLNTTNIRLRELDTQKTEFISLASHQLRGPLTSVKGYTTMILEGEFGKIPKKLEEPLRRIFASSQSLSSLINDFLDVSKLEKGELEYQIRPFNIVQVVDSVIADFMIIIKQAELTCTKTYDTDDQITVLGDQLKMRQVLMKIFDNAVKYTPTGGITVSIAIKHHDAVISISDTGIGVLREDMQDMFKKFKRAHNASEVSVIGSGLGLYVAKEMVEAQGGHMWVDSPGKYKGTRFFITLPLRDY
jgi:signal transduction histidine kinase